MDIVGVVVGSQYDHFPALGTVLLNRFDAILHYSGGLAYALEPTDPYHVFQPLSIDRLQCRFLRIMFLQIGHTPFWVQRIEFVPDPVPLLSVGQEG
jgi:hypothetical protein